MVLFKATYKKGETMKVMRERTEHKLRNTETKYKSEGKMMRHR